MQKTASWPFFMNYRLMLRIGVNTLALSLHYVCEEGCRRELSGGGPHTITSNQLRGKVQHLDPFRNWEMSRRKLTKSLRQAGGEKARRGFSPCV